MTQIENRRQVNYCFTKAVQLTVVAWQHINIQSEFYLSYSVLKISIKFNLSKQFTLTFSTKPLLSKFCVLLLNNLIIS